MVNQVLWNIDEKMKASAEGFKIELGSIRTGHASPALVEHIKVDYAGVPTPLNQMAVISAPEASLIVIQPWDRSTIANIEKAILKSDLGLNPVTSGNLIRLSLPPLSEERRQEMTRLVRKREEERKIAIRNLRHEAMGEMKEMEKNKELSQDEHKRALEQLQKLTDGFIADIEQITRDKEAELMEV
jgi:ribosome recycling factor